MKNVVQKISIFTDFFKHIPVDSNIISIYFICNVSDGIMLIIKKCVIVFKFSF